ncbi:MAG: DUF6364 family protein [Nanoarchaeota archaeon]
MGIRTFNIDEDVYKQFSAYCKKNGISMSKRVENFLREEISKIKVKVLDSKRVVEKTNIHAGNHSFSKYC